ncbi:MAG: hypothetical protein BJ554DRAFT_8423, partial [Olpidium bornovanus]
MAERKAGKVDDKRWESNQQHQKSTSTFEKLKAKGDEFLAALFGGEGSEPSPEPGDDNADADRRSERKRASGGPHHQQPQCSKKRRKSAGRFSAGGFAEGTLVEKEAAGGAAREGKAQEDDARTQAEMLARLSAHGRAFMERLGGLEEPVLNRKQQRLARRAAAAAASTELSQEEDIDSSEGEAEHTSGTESADATETDESESEDGGGIGEDAEPEAGGANRGGVVVVDASAASLFSASAESDLHLKEGRKAFLVRAAPVSVELEFCTECCHALQSSKICKTSEAPVRRPPTAADLKEDEEDRKNDAELMSILEASKLIEDYSAKQLSGKERRWWVANQAVKLGMKETPKHKMPLSMGLGLKAAQRKKDLKVLEEAKNIGLYHKSLKHNYAASAKRRVRLRKEGDRGLANVGVGRF